MAAPRNNTSFLLRIWAEPREEEGLEQVLRGYLRNLRTGEELFVADPGALSDEIKRQVLGDIGNEAEGDEKSPTRDGRTA